MSQTEIIKRPVIEILTLLLAVVMAAGMAVCGVNSLCEVLSKILL